MFWRWFYLQLDAWSVIWGEHSQNQKQLTGTVDLRTKEGAKMPLRAFWASIILVCVCERMCACVCECVCCVLVVVLRVHRDHCIKAFPDLSYFCFPHPAYWHGHRTQRSQEAQYWTDIRTGFHVHIVLFPHGQDGCLLFRDWLNKQRLRSHRRSLSLPTQLNCWMLSLSSSSVCIHKQSVSQLVSWLPITVIQQNCCLEIQLL